jgi:aminoglycoside 6-adenylyltransferase
VKYFGEIMILQLPDDMESADSADGSRYGYLMQFVDGNRIDLSICSLDRLEESVASDSLTLVLLDKDGRIENLAPASDMDYHSKIPTEKMFDDCCNEFWWLNPYTAKSLWRGELISARYFLDCNMRGELMKMLEWYFGVRTGFVKSMGKQGKFLREVLDELDWQMLENTYADAEPDNIWQALFMMGELFRKKGQIVAEAFGFKYPNDEDRRVTEFLHQIRALPEDATSFNQSQYRGGG